jgi:hypothetical protein
MNDLMCIYNNNNNNENFIEFFYALTIENLTVKGNLQLAT